MNKEIDPDEIISDLKTIHNKLKENPELTQKEVKDNSEKKDNYNIYEKLDRIEEKLDKLLKNFN